jgi:hypothetical protein
LRISTTLGPEELIEATFTEMEVSEDDLEYIATPFREALEGSGSISTKISRFMLNHRFLMGRLPRNAVVRCAVGMYLLREVVLPFMKERRDHFPDMFRTIDHFAKKGIYMWDLKPANSGILKRGRRKVIGIRDFVPIFFDPRWVGTEVRVPSLDDLIEKRERRKVAN